MPSQRRPVGARARGSWLPRLAGIGVIVLLAAGAVTGYLVVVHPARARPVPPLSTKVIGNQTVGLVAQDARPGSGGQLLQLLGPAGGPRFSRISPAELDGGSGQWTADLMAGNSYIFIYLASGDCLSAVGTASVPRLALRHCDLQASQRWRRVQPAVLSEGHDFYQYASLGDGYCLSEASELPGPVWGGSLSACSPAPPVSQLIAFWWATA
jgi:hypothetical protein